MSLSVTPLSALGTDAVSPITDHQSQKPIPKPTQNQEIETLASSGQSASQIATSLTIPVSDVDSTLGIASSVTSNASAVAALAGRLDVRA
jgi:hypothetical protein